MTTETFLRREIHRLAHVKVQLGRMQACVNTWTLQLAIVPPQNPKTDANSDPAPEPADIRAITHLWVRKQDVHRLLQVVLS